MILFMGKFNLILDKDIDYDWFNYLSINISKNEGVFICNYHLCLTTNEFEYKNKKFRLLIQNILTLENKNWENLYLYYEDNNKKAYEEFSSKNKNIFSYSYTDYEEMQFDRTGRIYESKIKLKYLKENLFIIDLIGKINLQDSFENYYLGKEIKDHEIIIEIKDFFIFDGINFSSYDDISIEKVKEISSTFVDLNYFYEPIKKELDDKSFLITFEPKI